MRIQYLIVPIQIALGSTMVCASESQSSLKAEKEWEAILQDDSAPPAQRLHLMGSALAQSRKEIKELRSTLVRLQSQTRQPGEFVCTIDDLFIGKAHAENEARAIAVKDCVKNNSFFFIRDCRNSVKCEKEVIESSSFEDRLVPEEKTELTDYNSPKVD